jgi:hypothetical protein
LGEPARHSVHPLQGGAPVSLITRLEFSVVVSSTRTRDVLLRKAGTSVLSIKDAKTGSTISTNTYSYGDIFGRESLTSEGTMWPEVQKAIRRNRENPTKQGKHFEQMSHGWDLGSGGFMTKKNSYEEYGNPTGSGGLLNPNFVGTQYYWSGNHFPQYTSVPATSTLWPVPDGSQIDNDLMVMGTSAIKKTVPTQPVASASQFLGELYRDGIPAMVGASALEDRIKWYQSLGSEYLNVEFGWKPFVSDLRKLWTAARDHEKILAQYRRDSGRTVRRRYSFPPLDDVGPYTDQVTVSATPALPTQCYIKSSGVRARRTIVSREFWFSGAYKYYYEEGSTRLAKVHKYAQEADKLLGLRLTPDVLYELAPWSWLVDWFANFGDILSNFTAFGKDGLVMQYGYIMGKYTQALEVSLTGMILGNGYGPELRQVFRTTTKTRRKATPFGFGLDPSVDFTARQWAILGALGLTRAPGKMM